MDSFQRRVVVTGLGVVAPNARNIDEFRQALKEGKSGISFSEELESLKFGCHVAGYPPLSQNEKEDIKKEFRLIKVRTNGLIYGVKAGMEAWRDAGMPITESKDQALLDTGCIFGAGALGVDAFDFGAPLVRSGQLKKIGSRLVLEAMNSATASYLSGIIGFGNQVTANSSACSTGTEAIIMAYDRIVAGKAECMLAGSCETEGPVIWGVFDSLRATVRDYNETPLQASRPMSAGARGFVPGAGAGALVLEERERAIQRGATIYAEIVGAAQNCGGEREGGSKTRPNQNGMIRCIRMALNQANLDPSKVDLISGHLTSTMADPIEIECWSEALARSKSDFPLINSVKSMTGHCIGAAGSIESVAAILQLNEGFVHKNLNCKEIHPKIAKRIDPKCIPTETLEQDLQYVMKANFGFGDVNACLIFKKA